MKSTGKRKVLKPYWAKRTLERKKVRNIMNNRQPAKKGGEPMTLHEARRWWWKQRKHRVPDGYTKLA